MDILSTLQRSLRLSGVAIVCSCFTLTTAFAQAPYAHQQMEYSAAVPPIVEANGMPSPDSPSFVLGDEPVELEMDSDQLYEGEVVSATEMLSVPSDSARPRVWFGAVDVSFLRPNVNLPRSTVSMFDGLGRSIVTGSDGTELEDFYTASRLTLGTKRNQRALVFRYWNLDIDEVDYFNSPNLPMPSSIIGVGHDQIGLDFTTIDFEFQKDMCCKCMDSSLSVGTRYVEFDSFALATAADLLQGETASITGFNQQNYKGMGIVGGWSGEIPIRNSGWSLAMGGRASAIFGTHFQRTVRSGGLGDQTAYAASSTRNSSSSTFTDTLGAGANASATAIPTDDPTLWIFEGRLNLKYSREFAGAVGYFSFGVEYQYWDLPEATTDAVVSINTALQDLEPVSNGLGLTGFNVSTGLTY